MKKYSDYFYLQENQPAISASTGLEIKTVNNRAYRMINGVWTQDLAGTIQLRADNAAFKQKKNRGRAA
jgi:hypothetical protein